MPKPDKDDDMPGKGPDDAGAAPPDPMGEPPGDDLEPGGPPLPDTLDVSAGAPAGGGVGDPAADAARIHRLAGTMKALGNSRWGRAVSTWRECIEIYGWDKPWPGFLPEGEFERVVAPPWLLASEGEKNQEFADKMEAGL